MKGIVQIEVGCFGTLTKEHIKTLKHIPILVVIGDYFASPDTFCQAQIEQLTKAGGDIKFALLPKLKRNSLYRGSPGPIAGNEHMMMIGSNNLEVADIVIGWLGSRGL